jgi:hypothetical protein
MDAKVIQECFLRFMAQLIRTNNIASAQVIHHFLYLVKKIAREKDKSGMDCEKLAAVINNALHDGLNLRQKLCIPEECGIKFEDSLMCEYSFMSKIAFHILSHDIFDTPFTVESYRLYSEPTAQFQRLFAQLEKDNSLKSMWWAESITILTEKLSRLGISGNTHAARTGEQRRRLQKHSKSHENLRSLFLEKERRDCITHSVSPVSLPAPQPDAALSLSLQLGDLVLVADEGDGPAQKEEGKDPKAEKKEKKKEKSEKRKSVVTTSIAISAAPAALAPIPLMAPRGNLTESPPAQQFTPAAYAATAQRPRSSSSNGMDAITPRRIANTQMIGVPVLPPPPRAATPKNNGKS